MIRILAIAMVISALASSYAFAFGLPAGISQLIPHATTPPGSCAPYVVFGSPPYRNAAAPPYRTGC